LGLATIFYCLTFETSLFVASYDSQGHGGGIRSRLHTGSPESRADHLREEFVFRICGNSLFMYALSRERVCHLGNDTFSAICFNVSVLVAPET
jgi:hypothetical protein